MKSHQSGVNQIIVCKKFLGIVETRYTEISATSSRIRMISKNGVFYKEIKQQEIPYLHLAGIHIFHTSKKFWLLVLGLIGIFLGFSEISSNRSSILGISFLSLGLILIILSFLGKAGIEFTAHDFVICIQGSLNFQKLKDFAMFARKQQQKWKDLSLDDRFKDEIRIEHEIIPKVKDTALFEATLGRK
jgi:hypothetical protein